MFGYVGTASVWQKGNSTPFNGRNIVVGVRSLLVGVKVIFGLWVHARDSHGKSLQRCIQVRINICELTSLMEIMAVISVIFSTVVRLWKLYTYIYI